MKIDRRSFLSFVIGGAAGTALSPLPWKLTDDSSIWSQNWPWTPVPQDGEYTVTNTVCTLCPGGCGISVRKVDDRAVKIEGIPGHPINDGGICILGLSGLQLLYGPTRISAPMKRVGVRGGGEWQEISWEEAIQSLAEKLTDIRSGGNPHHVACMAGSGRGTTYRLMDRFLQAYGSPNFIRIPSLDDSLELAIYRTMGNVATAGFDVENADFVVSFGAGLIEGWGSPVRMFRAKSQWTDSGARLVQIDSRLSITAAKSDKWVPINPGTEMALALGLAHVILKEALYRFDPTRFDDASFNAFQRNVLANYGPEKVAAVTGTDPSTIISLARAFARAKRPLALCGRGQGRTPIAVGEAMAVLALNALVGGLGREGGMVPVPDMDYIQWPDPEMDAVASAGQQAGRIDGADTDARCIAHRISKGTYGLEVLMVAGANPLYSLPDTAAMKRALADIPLIVSFSSYMDETAAFADLLLPNHHYLERFEDVPTPAGFPRQMLSLAKPVVAPLYNTRHTGDVMIGLANAMGEPIAGAFPWGDYQSCLAETLGDAFDTLLESVTMVEEGLPEMAIETDSGHIELPSGAFTAVAAAGDAKQFPLILLPYDSMRLASGYIGDPPFMVKTVEDTVLKGQDVFVDINPQTAGKLGFKDGARATLTTPVGKAPVRIHLSEGIMPGVVAMPRGLGHTAYDDYLAGKGQNFNDLIGPVEDPSSGLDAAWGIRAQLS
ncbi:MAG: menaquinone reductase molybdopterin-binding-like subunit QrcB [Pseudomonadota bacterium]